MIAPVSPAISAVKTPESGAMLLARYVLMISPTQNTHNGFHWGERIASRA